MHGRIACKNNLCSLTVLVDIRLYLMGLLHEKNILISYIIIFDNDVIEKNML